MIVITGARRSGTSLWMRLYKEAGHPIIGQAFPSHWASSIAEANPDGFFEAPLRHGIDARSNPDPITGEHYTPASTRGRVAKMFIPGLLRTDGAYVEKVVLTFRDWRRVWASTERLYALEACWHQMHGAVDEPRHWHSEHPSVPWPVAWWHEHTALLADARRRGLPVHRIDLLALQEGAPSCLARHFGAEAAASLAGLVTRTSSPSSERRLDAETEQILDHLLALLRRPADPGESDWRVLDAHRERLISRWGPYDPEAVDRG